jgi:hypothetical protein
MTLQELQKILDEVAGVQRGRRDVMTCLPFVRQHETFKFGASYVERLVLNCE